MNSVEIPGAVAGPDAPVAPEAPAAERPAWLPEKFKSPEELAKGYAELEKKLGGAKAPAADPAATAPADPAATAAVAGSPDEARAALSEAGLDYEAYAQEITTAGKLGDESYAALEKAGIPRDMVDAFIAGQTALGAQTVSAAHEAAGGEAEFKSLASWASQAADDATLEAYNALVAKGTPASAKAAVQLLRGARDAAEGSDANLIGGDAPGDNGGYASWAQVTAAMADPRYSKDPAYRAGVERRLASSPLT